jgi:hypothetical protein
MFVMISSFAELRIQAMVATIGVGCEEQPPTYAAINCFESWTSFSSQVQS